MLNATDKTIIEFLSTPSGWRATAGRIFYATNKIYFYPRPPGGGRPGTYSYTLAPTDFYPRPPGGGRHFEAVKHDLVEDISIHALRVEGDPDFEPPFPHIHISIHALRVEGDMLYQPQLSPFLFLSTPSGWRATL